MPMSTPKPTAHTFSESLGPDYAQRYAPAVKDAIERVAARRNGVVEIGVFEKRHDLTGLCIVATDQPGLLSRISEAFVVCGLDVLSAEAFTRDTASEAEAVDLFWLRRLNAGQATALTDEDLDQVRETLIGLIEGTLEPSLPFVEPSPVTRSNTRVRFIEDESGALTTLEIETEDRSGLLLSISRALFAQRVQILRSEVRTLGRRVVDRFKIAEFDGSPVGEVRRLEIQVAILSASEPAKRLSSMAPPPVT